MRSWLLAARPKTLTAGAVPVLVGGSLAWSEVPEFPWWIGACALLAALAIQIATNFLNDAIDFKKGSDREDRIGPQRVTQSGLLSPQKVMAMGFLFLFLAVLFGLPLVWHGGWPIISIGLFSLVLAYGYTGGPLPLAYWGLGDLFVFLFFGIIAVGGVYYLYVGEITWAALVAGAQVGMLATVLIAINNLRDINQDRISNKRTLAVVMGENFVKNEIVILLLSALVLLVFWIGMGRYVAGLLPLLVLPLVVRLIRGVREQAPSPVYNKFLAESAGVHLGFGILISLGFILS